MLISQVLSLPRSSTRPRNTSDFIFERILEEESEVVKYFCRLRLTAGGFSEIRIKMETPQLNDARDGPYFVRELKWVSIDGLPYMINEAKLRDFILKETGGEVQLDPEFIHLFHSDRHPGRLETSSCFWCFFTWLEITWHFKEI